ncbi:g7935 [Coccomyxa elongata]
MAPFQTDKRPIILFDGVCNLCNGGVKFALENDSKANLRFAALQSDTGKRLLQRCGRRPDDISSIVLVEPNACHIKSEAILRIGKLLRAPYPALVEILFPLPNVFRDLVYDRIAGNRYRIFGKSDVCRLTNADYSDRFIQ